MRRREGLSKLTGTEQYIDDVPAPVGGALWGMTVRSPAARGKIRSITLPDGAERDGFVIVDHRDIPGSNEVRLIENDQPVLADTEVRHVHEAVLLVAHASRDAVRRFVREVKLDIDNLPAALDYRVPAPQDQIQYGADNVLKRLEITKGDVAAALASAPHIIEGEYETGAQEHVYIEPQGMLAWVEDGVVVVQGSMQCPYYVVNALTHALNRSEAQVRVIQSATGGGFGGKEDYPSIIALHAALLAIKAKRPVKIIYDRDEDMAATTKRHPSLVRHRTAVDSDGRLLAQDIEVVMDGGAYVTLSPVVLSRGIIHAGGPYSCDNVQIRGRAMLTNSVPYGAFRGFGAPQTQFANERHMDVIARTLGIDPVELRRRNLIESGQTTSTGQVIDDGSDRTVVLDRALERSTFEEARVQCASFNAQGGHVRRGIGLACIYHGSGFTGSGEVYLKSKMHVASLPDGRVEVRSANTEMGQGTLTIFTKLASDWLGLDPDDIVIATPDTALVPNSGPTVASRTAMVAGRLVERACDDLRTQLGIDDSVRGDDLKRAIVNWHTHHEGSELVGQAQYEPPPGIEWNDDTYTGDAYGAYGWATYVAQIEIDLRTYGAKVTDFVAVQDVGTILNPTLARGQIQGGVVQAIGWALMESCSLKNGAMINNQLTNYIIPTADDVPAIRVEFIETPYPHGAQGARGLGELPHDGPAPAIANALAMALDADPTRIPLVPEYVMELCSDVQCV